MKLIHAKGYGLVWLQSLGISDTIAQAGSKFEMNKLYTNQRKKCLKRRLLVIDFLRTVTREF